MSELKHSMFTSVLYDTTYHSQLILSPHRYLQCHSFPYVASRA
jgi:hypothetical protein